MRSFALLVAKSAAQVLRQNAMLGLKGMLLVIGVASSGCAIFSTRPVQEMSDMSAAIRAAREVQADSLAPELFRQSSEWFLQAKREYKLKNFSLAADYAYKARLYAEQAEYESLKSGGSRTDVNFSDPLGPTQPSPPSEFEYGAPEGQLSETLINQQNETPPAKPKPSDPYDSPPPTAP